MSATPGQNTGLAGSPLAFGLGLVPGLLGHEQARARGRILEALSAQGGRTARRAGQSAAQAATARGLTGGAAAAFQERAVNDVLQNLALQEAKLEQGFLQQDIQGLGQIAKLAGTIFGGPIGAAAGFGLGQNQLLQMLLIRGLGQAAGEGKPSVQPVLSQEQIEAQVEQQALQDQAEQQALQDQAMAQAGVVASGTADAGATLGTRPQAPAQPMQAPNFANPLSGLPDKLLELAIANPQLGIMLLLGGLGGASTGGR